MFRKLMVALLVMALSGCTTLRRYEQPSAAVLSEHLEPGDRIRVLNRVGREYHLTVTQVTPEYFVGREADGKTWRFKWEQIQRLEREEIDGLKTTGAVVLWTAAILAVLAAIGAHAFGEAWEDAFSSD